MMHPFSILLVTQQTEKGCFVMYEATECFPMNKRKNYFYLYAANAFLLVVTAFRIFGPGFHWEGWL